MASNNSQNINAKAADCIGQAQATREHIANQPSNVVQCNQQRAHETKQEAGSFLQQTGEQVKNMAQGAAEAVKNTLGLNSDNNSGNNSGNCPSNASCNNPINEACHPRSN